MTHAQHVQEVELIERLPLLFGAVQERPRRRAEVADVVHQDVDARISNGQCRFRHLSHYMAVADIADHDRAQPARFDDRVACALGSICIDVGQHHVRPPQRDAD